MVLLLSLVLSLTPQQQYIAKHKELAQISSQKNGIPIEIILAQAIIESDCGRSNLARTKNNHFGIKRNGKYATFQTVADCFIAHGKIFAQPRYKRCRDCGDNVTCWALNLQPCGYAADKDYAAAILRVIKQNNL